MEHIKRPMLVGGIICCAVSVLLFYSSFSIPLFAIIATAVTLITIIFMRADKRLIFVLAAVLLIIQGAARCYNKIDYIQRLYGEEITAELTFCEDEQTSGRFHTSVVKLTGENKTYKNIKLHCYSYETGGYRQGDRIVAKIIIRGLEESSYRSGNFAENIFASCEIISVEEKLVCNKFGAFIGSIKRYVNNTLVSKLSYQSAATMAALVTGDKEYLSESFNSAVQCSGVSHVMVVSGLHLSIIMGAIYSVLSLFCKNRFLWAAVSTLAVFFMAAVCGFTMSIMRAGVMFIVAAVAPLVERENDTVNSLGTAVLLILIHSPFAIFSVALQLSALSTYGILVLAPKMSELLVKWFKIKNIIVVKFIDMLCVTLSATFMTFPIAVYRFGHISLTAPLTNILITYAVSTALIIAVAGLLTNLVSFLATFTDWIYIFCELVVKYINYIIKLLGREWAVIEVGRWAVLPSVFLHALALYLINYCKRRDYLLKLEKIIKEKGE